MLALVTRPEPQATAWAQALQQAGVTAHALPLIAISAPADSQPVAQLWRNLASYRALMFVSPAAVDWFMRLRPDQTQWPQNTLACAPGPGTAKQLLAQGAACLLLTEQLVSPAADAPQFDSETLWPLLADHDWVNQKVCIVSGGDNQDAKGRTWLTQQWRARGAHVDTLLTYQRGPAIWTPAQQLVAQQALAHPAQHTWLLSSSEALGFLQDHAAPSLTLTSPPDWSTLRVLVTHPRIAERAQQLGISHIIQTRPDLAEVVQALRSAT
ncbi:MAG: uroporphyrinogen-III synthase [Burkholderiales bacterium]|nr:uroporphyrinogen-III synthase [Burkholderiales bacterium]